MQLQTVLHHRFTGDRGAEFVYVATSAAILGLDPLASEVVAAFAAPGGADATAWLENHEQRGDAETTLHDLIDLGVIRPVGEPAPPRAQLPPMPFPIATLVLNVTNKCNLTCTYCYEYGADRLTTGNGSAGTGKARMDDDTARQSIDFLMRNSGDRPQVSITFFGGETLLNFPAIRAATEYAEERGRLHKKRVHFSLTTNATLLSDEVVDFLTTHRFGITVSIDGNQEEQDRHRTFRGGVGSFETIAPRIRHLVAANKQKKGRSIGARVTLTAGASAVADTYRFLTEELGFDEVGFAPVTAGLGRDYALGEAGYERLLREFGELAEDYVAAATRGEAHGFANLGDLLRELHQGVNKAHPCGAGLGLLGVSTEGELGLCHRFVESKSHAVGHVATGIDEAVRTAFLQKAHVDQKTDCTQCFARPLCAGGCYHEAHVRYGDATKANLHYCEWIRGFVDLGLRSYGRILTSNPKFFARFES
ncbi:MAG TPA: quinohemoprotein amine dehydrogenase maturation protein [Planctomycetota bacterium]|nr:quinohemoprotein amine dehydrogenase maturation protein [Planctomycetota bacterium]